ncbi:MAG: aminotransferase class V-fold PLP-dependent enzyme, partial [Woeseiaceae bacterium]|nr:aminotransferase class V-fold PLP-dependent enzyme [Woeseiaceae bacterium]
VERMAEGFEHLPGFVPEFDETRAREVLLETAERMQDNYPYWHPQYAGQMLKPPHAVARIAYAMSLWVNPNNHALDGSRASSPMEQECIRAIADMVGFEQPLGHLTGGGTMANLEALWVAGRLHPGKKIVASSQAHYTHGRISEVLGLEFTAADVTVDGRMDAARLEALLAAGDVGTVVATLGNTGLGAIDPLHDIVELCRHHDARVHVDAAYGGYFGLASELEANGRAAFDAVPNADSIVIDPHKHGLQPYGCGSVLFRDPAVGRFYKHGSPYTYFTSADLHLGEISLECSRPGASAVALWATLQMFPLEKRGEFAAMLDACLAAGREFHERLSASTAFAPLMPPELDIVVYALRADDSATASERAQRVFEEAARRDLHLALIKLPTGLVTNYVPDMQATTASTTCLRSVLMKPEQRDWLDSLVSILEESAAA